MQQKDKWEWAGQIENVHVENYVSGSAGNMVHG